MSDVKQQVVPAKPQPTPEQVKHGTLMIVEDDALLLKIFERFFSKHYNLITSKSGNEALELIKKGVRPEVILSDQRMPGLSGDEFLAETIKYIPDTVRTILTAHSDPKEIIAAINRAHTYMFLTKPIEEIELVQAVRLCFTHYYTQMKNKNLQRELSERNQALQNATQNAKSVNFASIIQDLNSELSTINKYFFGDLFQICIPIIKSIAISMKLNTSHYENIVLSLNTYIYAMNFMPLRFLVTDPENMSDLEKGKFFALWQTIVKKIASLDGMAFPCEVVSQLWENYDGSGYPKKMTGSNILTESQILKIVLIYANSVFRIPNELFEKRTTLPDFKQPLAVTAHRHKSVTKIVFDRSKWFDTDLSNQFRFMLQDTANEAFSYERRDITIPNRDYEPEIVEEKINLSEKSESSADKETSTSKERTVSISALQEGMIVGQRVVTKSGILVARSGAELTPQIIKNIQHLESTGQLNLNGMLDITIP